MKRPKEAVGGIPTPIKYPEDVDRSIEAQLDKIVHDSKYNFRSTEEGDKTVNPERRGLPRHEW